MKRLMMSVSLMFALFGLVNAGPDDNSRDGPYFPFNISYKDRMVFFNANTYYEVYSINGSLIFKGYGSSINFKALNPTTNIYFIKTNGYIKKIIFTK